MKVQLVRAVVEPCAVKVSVRVAPGAMDRADRGGSIYKVSPSVWNKAFDTARMSSPGNTATNSQPLTAVPPLLTMVNWPWKLCGCCRTTR